MCHNSAMQRSALRVVAPQEAVKSRPLRSAGVIQPDGNTARGIMMALGFSGVFWVALIAIFLV